MLLFHRTLVLVLVNNKTIYQVYVFLSNSELDAIASKDGSLVDTILGPILKAGLHSAVRKERPAKDMDGNAGIEVAFEVETIEARDRLLAWLKMDPFEARDRLLAWLKTDPFAA